MQDKTLAEILKELETKKVIVIHSRQQCKTLQQDAEKAKEAILELGRQYGIAIEAIKEKAKPFGEALKKLAENINENFQEYEKKQAKEKSDDR